MIAQEDAFCSPAELIAKKRQAFLLGNMAMDNTIREEIAESWTRSRNAGINPQLSALPQLASTEIAIKTATKNWTFKKYIHCPSHKKLYHFLQTTKSIIFYADINLNIILQRGDEQLLNEVNSFNLGIGANLEETVIGTNALALAALTQNEQWIVGAEHYIEALQDFACIAIPIIENDQLVSYAMFVTKIADFNLYQPPVIRYFTNWQSSIIKRNDNNIELSLINEMLKLSINQRERGVILVDHYGRILRVNEWIVHNLGRVKADVCGSYFKNIFPELAEAANCLKTGTPILFKEILFRHCPNTDKAFYMECQPIKKDQQYIGIIVFLIDSNQIHEVVHQVGNYRSHFTFNDLIGANPCFIKTKAAAETAADSNSNILIIGESGTGKELFAQAIHAKSSRKRNAFVSINCAAIPKELIASELFGYSEGAFTGAKKGGAPGKFELANKGTLFLDEIGEMPLELQSVLLRVLEEREVPRLGSNTLIPVDVRFIAATNKDLWQLVLDKHFRLDLYYRLNVVKIEIPPLRNRRDDIPLLVNSFLLRFNSIQHKNVVSVTSEAMNLLGKYPWPGNIRELRNVIERAIIFCSSHEITLNDLPLELSSQKAPVIESEKIPMLSQALSDDLVKKLNEKELIADLLQKHNGNKTRVAKELGITRATLYRKQKFYDLC